MTQDELLVEQVTSAHRSRDVHGAIQGHPAFFDLDGPGRLRAFDEALHQRRLEAALDPEGLSTTARAVLARLGGAR